jgi:hypothetical protein
MRQTPYAANEDEARDYELDRLEREKEIAESEKIQHMRRMLKHCKKQSEKK